MSEEHENWESVDPILVRFVPPKVEKTVAADIASFRTINFAAGDNQAIRLFAQDSMRHKVQIIVHNPLGVAAPAIPGYCFLAQQSQVSANGDARGAAIVAGDNFPYEAASQAWLVPAGVAVSVTVIEERNVSTS